MRPVFTEGVVEEKRCLFRNYCTYKSHNRQEGSSRQHPILLARACSEPTLTILVLAGDRKIGTHSLKTPVLKHIKPEIIDIS